MNRYLLGAAALALCAAAPALAADYPELRPAYEPGWESNNEDSLRFEAGVRYWYSIGSQQHSIGSFTETMDTKTSSGELFGRVIDDATRSYLEATGGYGIMHEGSYSTNGGDSVSLPAARLGYLGADFGWLPLGSGKNGVGFVTGYQYTNDSPDTGRANFTTAKTSSDINWSPDNGSWSVGADSEVNDFHVHALKLGLAGSFDANVFDVTGEAYATPYAWVSGTYGAYNPGFTDALSGGPGGVSFLQGSAATINGFGYGGGGKLMVGIHPTENFTIRVGGRGSYLQGQYDATYDGVTINEPARNPDIVDPDTGVITLPDPLYSAPSLSSQTYISNNNPFSMFRYGALVEISGSF